MKYYEVQFAIDAPDELMQTGRDILSSLAADAGFETFEDTADGVTGYVQQQLFDREALEDLVANFPLPHCYVGYTIHVAEYRDWNEEWEQQGFDPIEVGRFIIHDGRDHSLKAHTNLPSKGRLAAAEFPDSITSPSGKGLVGPFLIEIHARQTFGTGTHETTRMMVSMLADTELKGKRVLDCGTGTGILAIAALKGGAREAVSYDIDEWSTENARHNAGLNGVDEQLTVLLGDVSVLDGVEGSFDIVMANINRNILLTDMPAMAAKLTPGGVLALSGFLTDDVPLLIAKAGELGLDLKTKKNEGEWVCLVFTSKNGK